MILRKINREVLEKAPYEEWNAFINLIAMEPYEDLNQIQRIAHLCFWYDSEVQNGGHIQYFENQGTDRIDETMNALKSLNASSQAEILKGAYVQYCSKTRKKIIDLFSFIAASREEEYGKFDRQYYECQPRLIDLLEGYFEKYRENFIIVV